MFSLREKQNEEIEHVLRDIMHDENVQKMKNYIQHGNVSTYDHCINVAYVSYSINKKLRLNANIDTLVKGAALHDFYLYDWHNEDGGAHRLHGFTHAEQAAKNAERFLKADDSVQDVIRCHMWPLNITKIPRCREAWIICIADKYVSLYETLFMRRASA